ncbi:MAG TPA: SLC13 family permease, partial [Hellea balneolensis]|nr:SLC13 family permease [Hellea balneolensis]
LISLYIIVVFLIFFQVFPLTTGENLTPVELLSGFADPALMTIMALLVIGQGIAHTGALERPTRRLNKMLVAHPKRTLFLVFLVAFCVSMFMNNTPVVVMFIPILSAMAIQLRGSASRIMMPLSFICILAGMTTLVGSSTNILVSGALERSTGDQIGFFEPFFPGILLALIGVVYIVFMGRWLLPKREYKKKGRRSAGQQYIAPIRITKNHPLVGRKPVAGLFPDLRMMTVRMIDRQGRKLLPPFEDALEPGDILTVSATRKALTGLLSAYPEYLKGMLSISDYGLERKSERMVISEAIVAPGSEMIGKTIENAGFRRQTGCLVLGLQRKSHMYRNRMINIELKAGDVLLLFGYVGKIEAMRDHHDLLLLDWATAELPDIRKANIARLIFLSVILGASLGIIPILHAALAGAGLMIAMGCLNIPQAIRALDSRIYMLIGAAFAMGLAMERTGGASYIAHQVVAALQGFGPQILIGGLFLLVAVMTNLLSNSATAILFAPISIGVANQTGIDPKILILTVLFAANCSFATPIAYQTNLLVMGPGHYKFIDYMKFGIPLILVLWISYVLMLPFVFAL